VDKGRKGTKGPQEITSTRPLSLERAEENGVSFISRGDADSLKNTNGAVANLV
jgi:hypothetical protein